MSADDGNWALQANFKFGEQYKETLLNVRADSAEEFQALVEFAVQSAEAIVGAAVAFGAAYEVLKPKDNLTPPPQSWSSQGSRQSQQPAAPAQAPAGPPPTCAHGPMRYVKGGTSKAGRPYKAFWSCTGPRESQCDTVDA